MRLLGAIFATLFILLPSSAEATRKAQPMEMVMAAPDFGPIVNSTCNALIGDWNPATNTMVANPNGKLLRVREIFLEGEFAGKMREVYFDRISSVEQAAGTTDDPWIEINVDGTKTRFPHRRHMDGSDHQFPSGDCWGSVGPPYISAIRLVIIQFYGR